MFLQVCVCPQGGRHPSVPPLLGADTPLGPDPPGADTPPPGPDPTPLLGADPPGPDPLGPDNTPHPTPSLLGPNPPWDQTPLEQTPPPPMVTVWAVRILLECILVHKSNSVDVYSGKLLHLSCP